jgi:hypothetical protein
VAVNNWVRRPEDLSRIAKDMPRQASVEAASEKEFRRSAEQLRAKFGQPRQHYRWESIFT